MKKTVSLAITLLLSVSTYADISIELKNNSGVFYEAGSEGSTFIDQALVQLIWTPYAPTPQAGIGGALGTSEYLLNSLVTSPSYAGTWADQPQGALIYYDSDVGNNDINAGYLFVRIFETAVPAADDYYLHQFVQGPGLTEFDTFPDPPPSPYDTSGSLGGVDMDAQGYQVIPEPAVASLISIFGIGMIFGRRIFRKS